MKWILLAAAVCVMYFGAKGCQSLPSRNQQMQDRAESIYLAPLGHEITIDGRPYVVERLGNETYRFYGND